MRESEHKAGETKLGWSKTKLEETGECKTKLEVGTENPKFAEKG